MSIKNKANDVLLYACLLTFISFVAAILFFNREVLYTAHERSEYLYGSPFFHTLLSKPFGLMQYVGGWLTQFFYVPAVGGSILAAIWALIFFVGMKAFRLQGSAVALMILPVACLLTSIVDLGYWIYIFTVRGYWFSQSVAYLLMLLLLWVARSTTSRDWHFVWYLIGICLYPVLGWFSLLFVLCLALSDKISWRELLAIVFVFFTAHICRTLLYSNLKIDDVVMAGLPKFENPSDKSDYLSAPFWILGVVSILISLFGRHLAKRFVPIVSAILGILFTVLFMYSDRNYIDEMRMVRSAEKDNWKEVIDIVSENPNPTVSMIMLKNIALMNEGGLLDRSFKMNNIDFNICNPDSLHVSFLEIAAPVAYYHYGMLNEAIRLNFENAIQAGFSPIYLKMLSRCALATGDAKLLQRYTNLLHHHPFYRHWNPLMPTHAVSELRNAFPDELTGVENSDSYIVNSISMWNKSESKVASEQALFYSMIRRDSRRFWASLRNFVNLHQGEQFPVHAQEAYIMYTDKAPEAKRMMLPVEQSVLDRYKSFWTSLESCARNGLKPDQIEEEMRPSFGDTYWYYNIFGKRRY
ncbi:MAG: DUF6057 family protein [Bacteroidales bacterium]|nr:DUF6057 family protein [Bacteroidales bacterium]